MIKAFALPRLGRANGIDRIVVRSARRARFGIMTAGKAYLDVRQALTRLGIDRGRARASACGVYKVGMTWPLETEGLRDFAAGKRRQSW